MKLNANLEGKGYQLFDVWLSEHAGKAMGIRELLRLGIIKNQRSLYKVLNAFSGTYVDRVQERKWVLTRSAQAHETSLRLLREWEREIDEYISELKEIGATNKPMLGAKFVSYLWQIGRSSIERVLQRSLVAHEYLGLVDYIDHRYLEKTSELLQACQAISKDLFGDCFRMVNNAMELAMVRPITTQKFISDYEESTRRMIQS